MILRATIEVDYEVPEGTDPDEFHDELRELLEDRHHLYFDAAPYGLDGIWSVMVRELDQ